MQIRHRLLAALGILVTFLGLFELATNLSLGPTTPKPVESTFSNATFAVAVKTSHSRMYDTIPILMATSLVSLDARTLVLGDVGNSFVGGVAIVDVVTGLYDKTKKRLLHKQDLNDEAIPEYLIDSAGEDAEFHDTTQFDANVRLRRRNPVEKADDEVYTDKKKAGDLVVTKEYSSHVDPHKNLAGLQLLYEKFPDTDWFLLINDDTTVVFHNLRHFIKHLDPEKPFYIGKPTDWKGCDGVTQPGEGPVIGIGASGILVSRGGMKALSVVIESCILKYSTCFGGDIRTGLCFRDAGVKLTWENNFNLEPPFGEEFTYPDDPCDVPHTFGASLAEDMVQMSTLEHLHSQKHPHTPLTMGHLYKATSNATTSLVKHNMDRPGGAYRVLRIGDAQSCELACRRDRKKCVAWVVDYSKKCLLKTTPGRMKKRKGVVSGVLVERYTCRRKLDL
ncbi:hypothetical protein HDU98_004309 [Podochytrium sp. JEL0797]|nr:hypothetical protein HDU98_004309 [Podochytrium sp. JEL0797]